MRRTAKSTASTRGFTIVELIVIIAVIGILATIGTMSWSGAQNRAKKSNFQATAEQVKLKLGEYRTDKNRYPASKGDIETYLGDTGSGTLRTEFAKSAYSFTATPSGCATTGTTACTGYTITVAKTNWNGSGTDTDITITP